MKCKELIEIIKKDNLEEYDIEFVTDWTDIKDNGYLFYENVKICDVGVSDKVVILSGDRK